MKRTLRTLGLLIITVLLTVGLAQQTQQTQQTQEAQQQAGQQVPNFPDFESVLQALAELRVIRNELGVMINDGQPAQPAQLEAIHTRVGAIINEFERHMTEFERFEERIIGLERGARASTLREVQRGLRGLRADIEAGERPEETAREIGRFRADVRGAFAGTTGEEQQRATELEEQFRTLEEQVRTGAAEAQTTFEATLDRLEQDIERGQQQFEREGRRRAIQTAGQRLEGLRADIEGGRYHEGVIGEIGQIRGDVERAFRGAEGEERQLVEGVFQELRTLEEQVGAGSEEARGTLNRVTQQFQQLYNQLERQ